MQLTALIIKELRLLGRDIHGLALLFAMPVVFIVIMSLAMKDDFDRRSGVQLDILVDDQAATEQTQSMLSRLEENPLFRLLPVDTVGADPETVVQADDYSFLLTVSEKAFASTEAPVATVLVAPGNSSGINQLFIAALREAAGRENLALMLNGLQAMMPDLPVAGMLDGDTASTIVIRYAGGQQKSEAPTSVQQSVPAWLVFSVFFVVVPLANTLINERQLGTLRRMRTVDVADWKLLLGKVIPYYCINQLQVLMMLLVGVYLVPLLGGDRLTLGNSWPALCIVAAALSVAALGYGMLIAVVSQTTEQATTLGGAGNIILAALGGIMVPAFVMPEFMQSLTVISPMSWGLQGFLDVLLRGGGVPEVMPEALSLLLLGAITLGSALFLFHRRMD